MSGEHGMVGYLVDVECTRRGYRVFHNSVGRAWLGHVTEEFMVTGKHGPEKSIELFGAHMIPYGLCNGSSDRIGWRPVKISPEMVGMTIAQFVAIECKTPAYDKCSEQQKNFLGQVAKAGGLALIARRRGVELELEEVKP
jgi:hypothetical protein